jgi:hypothetical protein
MVMVLALSGSTVFAGGFMMGMDWRTRYSLAAFDAATGALRDWNADVDPSNYQNSFMVL